MSLRALLILGSFLIAGASGCGNPPGGSRPSTPTPAPPIATPDNQPKPN